MTRTFAQGGILLYPRLSAAAALIVLSGLPFSAGAAEKAAVKQTQAKQADATQPVRAASVKSASRSATKAPARRGVVPEAAVVPPPVPLRDPNMTASEAVSRAADLATMLLRENRLARTAIQPTGGPDQAGQGAPEYAPSGGRKRDINPTDTGFWPPSPGVPPIGQGIAQCLTESQTGDFDPGRSFVNMSGTNRWQILPIASDAVDLDGDGEPDDPLPQRPVVIYYQFLEENMTELEWDEGEDNLNQIGLRTSDDCCGGVAGDEPDDVIDLNDTPDEEDGISDTWTENPARTALHVLPPPVLDDFDENTAIWLSQMGLGTIRWGNGRPIFLHPDAEAAWRLAQREYRENGEFNFDQTFAVDQVLTPEERDLFRIAFEAIESVANVIFIERSDDFASFNTGYPFAPKGYTLDPFSTLVTPGTVNDGIAPNLIGDEPFFPEDDYPWILIVKGDPFGGEGGNFATTLGANRLNGFGPTSTYYSSYDSIRGNVSGVFDLIDFDRDGFPDTPDLDADTIPDQIILSSQTGVVPAGNNPGPPIPNIFDADSSGAVTNADTSLNGSGAINGLFPIDLDGDGTAGEGIVDALFGGIPPVPTTFMFLDSDNDNAADSVFGLGFPSLAPQSQVNVPCELLNMNTQVLAAGGVGVIVHEIMHHMGFAHEHQRPDRDEFITVDFNNLNPGGADQLTAIPGGTDQYANWVNNFDITPPDPVDTPPDDAINEWTIDNTGAVDGGFTIAEPVIDAAGFGPQVDFDPDPTDVDSVFAVNAAVTGNVAGQDLDGTSVMLSPVIYGPADATVRFAYWLASDTERVLDPTDGLFVQSTNDGGVTWRQVAVLQIAEPGWRQVEITIGDDRTGAGLSRDPNFQIRFVARDIGVDDTIEAAVDYVRIINPYDFQSIMHYGEFAFSIAEGIAGFETITVNPPYDVEFGDTIGFVGGLSQGDRIALRNLYGVAPVPDDLVGSDDPCRADVNLDGTIDSLDVLIYLEWYNAGDIRADFAQPEGVIDVFDLLQFFIDLQFSFSCIPGDLPLGGNTFEPVDPA